ncbi:MAG: hypothetical protein CVU61_09125 [Deltaproteobacteria bacterium HGW-Deltaproteobacteria-19]|jgi:hypothetical protein|nr:MAG: hypothetical protein CVU61_09125 [Deltaproteobacteria bacterium HGW-Deltaproteobacteria-19]
MKKEWLVISLLLVFWAGTVLAGDQMVITFQDGRTQSFDTSTILRIEFQTAGASSGSMPALTGCWTGRFRGTDTSGYAMDINLRETDGRVEGGYAYYHRGQQRQVTAVIADATITGRVLRGTWRQVSGIPAEGRFEWTWLPGSECQAFEGSFDGTRFWRRMTRQ